MAVEFVFYEISSNVSNAPSWRAIEPFLIKPGQINNGHKPNSGEIFDLGDAYTSSVIAVLKDDPLAISIVQNTFKRKTCLGSMACASLKDAQTTIRFFLRGAVIPTFKPFNPELVEETKVALLPRPQTVAAEVTKKREYKPLPDWRKTVKPAAQPAPYRKPNRFIFGFLPQREQYDMVMAARKARLAKEASLKQG